MSSPSEEAKSVNTREPSPGRYSGPERRQGDRRRGLGTPHAGRLDTRMSVRDRRRG